MKHLLLILVLALLTAPAWANDYDDDCDHDEITTYSPRHRNESWGDYYRRNQEQVERQYREPHRDRH